MKRERRISKIKRDNLEITINGVSFVFGTFMLALCYNLFFVPNDIVVGGTSGLAIILSDMFGINEQIFIYSMALILLIISRIFLGKDITKNTVLGSILYPLFITLSAPVADFLLEYMTFSEMLVPVAIAALLYGYSNGIIYKYGYTTGGSDVIMQLMCKYLHLTEGTSLNIFNTIIIGLSMFTFGVEKGVYGIIILLISSLVIDRIVIGISDSKKFMIYTRQARKVTKLIKEFDTGYTIFPTIGGYSHFRGAMIMVVISNRDVNLFKECILDIDPQAFFVVSDCYQVQGGTKKNNLPFI